MANSNCMAGSIGTLVQLLVHEAITHVEHGWVIAVGEDVDWHVNGVVVEIFLELGPVLIILDVSHLGDFGLLIDDNLRLLALFVATSATMNIFYQRWFWIMPVNVTLAQVILIFFVLPISVVLFDSLCKPILHHWVRLDLDTLAFAI